MSPLKQNNLNLAEQIRMSNCPKYNLLILLVSSFLLKKIDIEIQDKIGGIVWDEVTSAVALDLRAKLNVI